jgi:hypothetical protein
MEDFMRLVLQGEAEEEEARGDEEETAALALSIIYAGAEHSRHSHHQENGLNL